MKDYMKVIIVVFAIIGVFGVIDGAVKTVSLFTDPINTKTERENIATVYEEPDNKIIDITIRWDTHKYNRIVNFADGSKIYLIVQGDGDYIEEIKRKL